MKSIYPLIALPIVLLIEIALYLQDIISIQGLVNYLTILSSVLILLYIIFKIIEKNPTRFHHLSQNPDIQKKSDRFDFRLVENILKNTFYFSSMLFVFSSIIVYLLIDTWAYDVKYTMGIFGFYVVIMFIKVIEEIYTFIEDECEKKV